MVEDDNLNEAGYDARGLVDLYARWRRRGAFVILIGMALAIVGVVIIGVLQPPPPPLDTGKLGVHLLLDDGRNRWDESLWAQHMAYAGRVAGDGGMAVQVVRGDDLQVARWQTFMDLAAEHDLTPVLRLATTYDFEQDRWRAPQDADALATAYADFVAALDWHGSTPHVILFNEVNQGNEWGGRPDPAAYARFHVTIARALREAVPDGVILNAALSLYAPHTGTAPLPDTDVYFMDAETFLDAVIAAQPDFFDYVDVWNSHVYPLGAFREAPWVQEYRFDFVNDAAFAGEIPPDGIMNRGINGYEWELWKLSTYGVTDLPVMITEMGWRHAESTVADALDAGEGYPDARTAARYYDMALRGNLGQYPSAPRTGWTPLLRDERVMGVAPFALNGVPDEWGHTNLLQLNAEGAVLGTYAPFDTLENLHD